MRRKTDRILKPQRSTATIIMIIIAFLTLLIGVPPMLVAGKQLDWWPFGVDYTLSTKNPYVSAGTYEQSNTASEEPEENDSQAATGCYVGGEVVPCHTAHDQEVYSPMSAGGCDEGSLILYLGGDPDVDVLGEELLVAESEYDPALCTVTSSGDLIDGSLEGIWSTDGDRNGYPDGGRYRRCFTYQQQPISCDEEHSDEVFYESEEDVDCISRYEMYSGRKVERTIAVVRETVGTTVTCRVKVRVPSDTLFASVRGIEDVSLPLR